MSNIQVKNLLNKYNLYTKEIQHINYHLNVGWCNASMLVKKVVGLENLTEEELVQIVYGLILKCDSTREDYDYKIDEEMTRIGLKTNKFYGKNNLPFDYELDYDPEDQGMSL